VSLLREICNLPSSTVVKSPSLYGLLALRWRERVVEVARGYASGLPVASLQDESYFDLQTGGSRYHA